MSYLRNEVGPRSKKSVTESNETFIAFRASWHNRIFLIFCSLNHYFYAIFMTCVWLLTKPWHWSEKYLQCSYSWNTFRIILYTLGYGFESTGFGWSRGYVIGCLYVNSWGSQYLNYWHILIWQVLFRFNQCLFKSNTVLTKLARVYWGDSLLYVCTKEGGNWRIEHPASCTVLTWGV